MLAIVDVIGKERISQPDLLAAARRSGDSTLAHRSVLFLSPCLDRSSGWAVAALTLVRKRTTFAK